MNINNKMKAVMLNNVWEQYRIKFVREGRVSWEHVWALEAINLEIEKGETVGIIGENGAGKTTLLKVIAGMLCPDKGQANVQGRVSCLMELGTGFHPELTGRENVFLNANLYGLRKEEIEKKIDQIVEFSGIDKFIDAIVKSYSQGMYMRLAFALAIHVDPDILLIDDVLAIGDEDAQRKCINKIFELKERGTTILFVTHDMDMAARLCRRAVFLKNGRIVKDGFAKETIFNYLETVKSKEILPANDPACIDKKVSLRKGALELVLDLGKGRIRIYYKNREVTQDNGLYTALYSENTWYHSFDSSWQVEKMDDENIFLILKYPQLSLCQHWHIKLIDDNSISLDLSMDAAKEITLTGQNIRLEANNKYINWSTPCESGDFVGGDYINDIKPVRLKNSKIKNLGLMPNTEAGLPYLTFGCLSDGQKTIASLYRARGAKSEKVNLHFSRIISCKEYTLSPGRYACFKGKISVNKELERAQEVLDASSKICKGNLSVVFDDGRAKIFYSGKELTAGLGMYTSVRSSGVWYDSYQAAWNIREISNEKIIIGGDWPYIPISQIWQVEVLDGISISWKIKMEAHDKFNKLEFEQINLMLNPSYKDWVALDKNHGIFLDEFAEDYDILPYRFWYGPAKGSLKASSADFPSISFFAVDKKNDLQTIIGNTDSIYKARLMQFQTATRRESVNDNYFDGVIEIEPIR